MHANLDGDARMSMSLGASEPFDGNLGAVRAGQAERPGRCLEDVHANLDGDARMSMSLGASEPFDGNPGVGVVRAGRAGRLGR